jgi:hypothetical protein
MNTTHLGIALLLLVILLIHRIIIALEVVLVVALKVRIGVLTEH